MNPNSATLRSTDICALLGVSDQSLYRWLSDPYPTFVWSNCSPRGRTYALPEVVARLREHRRKGLYGDLAALVAHDTDVRAQNGEDGLWLDHDAQDRSAAFCAALAGDETERARSVMKAMRGAAMAAGLSGINRLAQVALIHTGVVRFILSGEADELPVGDAGWQSFAKALWAVNPPVEKYEAA